VLLIPTIGLFIQAQTVTRLKSWGFLESPPAPVESFTTSVGAFQIDYVWPNSQLYRVNADGSRTFLSKLRKSIGTKSFRFLESDNQVMFAYSESDSVFFYLTDGTAQKTKLVYTYRGSGSHQFDFAIHRGKAYIAYDTGWNFFKGLVEIDPADGKSKIIFNKSSEDIHVYSVVSNGNQLFVNYRSGTENAAYLVNVVDGSLTLVTNKLAYWIPEKPFVRMGNHLGFWMVKDTSVVMNGSKFQTSRLLLQRYNSTTQTLEAVWPAGYFQAALPDYLGEINGKHYFFTTGDLQINDCQSTSCSGKSGAYLWEIGSTARLVKGIASEAEKFAYGGKKQIATDKIYLEIDAQSSGKELWVASPTDLYLVKDHNPGARVLDDYGLNLEDAAVCGGNIAIPGIANLADQVKDFELYVSDGTVGNLKKVDVLPRAGVQSMPKGLVSLMDKILFIAADTIKDNLGIAMTTMYSIDLCGAGTTSVPVLNKPDSRLFVYPNPARSKLKINASEEIEMLEIFSLTGNLILKVSRPGEELDVSQMEDGMYLIRATTSTRHLIRKIQVLK